MFLYFVLIFLLVFYFFYFREIKYWKDKDVPFKMPFPFFGNLLDRNLRRKNFSALLIELYKEFADSRYFVSFGLLKGLITIKDPEILKMVTVKEFDTFPIHQGFVGAESDPLWNKNLFAIQDPEKWRQLRATLSPTFTTSKMRLMFKLMNECATNLVGYYLEKKETIVKINVKDMFTRYANDVIASTAFGISCDSTRDRDNEFYLMGRHISNFEKFRSIKYLPLFAIPSLAKVFKVPFIDETAATFFRRLIKENIQSREEKGIVRPDMIHLLMEARKNLNRQEVHDVIEDGGFAIVEESEIIKKEAPVKRELTDDDIAAQAILFFLGGFETVSTVMSFTAMELAANIDVQNKLAEEISDLYRIKGNSPSYEDILRLTYLDMVVSESLRKWPPSQFIDRKCTKPYTLKPPKEGGKPVYIPKGSVLWIPIFAIHRDENNYPNPEVFDPERFSQENKAKVKPYTYLPFGLGPRNCIASRYALMEVKIIFYHLLAHLEIIPVEETRTPITLDMDRLQPTPEGGFVVGLKQRKY